MDIRKLDVFRTAVELKSFTKAVERLIYLSSAGTGSPLHHYGRGLS